MSKPSPARSSAEGVPDFSGGTQQTETLGEGLWARIRGVFSKVSIHRSHRRLRVCESISLGDKRLVAVVECEHRLFLIGATAHHISLLQALDGGKSIDPELHPL